MSLTTHYIYNRILYVPYFMSNPTPSTGPSVTRGRYWPKISDGPAALDLDTGLGLNRFE